MIKKIIYLIPNTLTLVSLFLGFSAIVFSIQAINDLYLNTLKFATSETADPEYFIALAGLSIFLASIFDFLDGFSARILRASTPMGKQLDSLADFVSFGVAPAVLFFTITLIATEYVPEAGINYFLVKNDFTAWMSEHVVFFKLFAFILPSCTVFRLAKFNLASEKKPYFEGLPSTYAGALLGIILTFNFYVTPLARLIKDLYVPEFFLFFVQLFEKLFFNYLFLTATYVLLAFLMVTRIRFYRIDAILANRRLKQYVIPILIGLALLSAFFFKYVYIVFGIGYLVYCIMYSIVKRKKFTRV